MTSGSRADDIKRTKIEHHEAPKHRKSEIKDDIPVHRRLLEAVMSVTAKKPTKFEILIADGSKKPQILEKSDGDGPKSQSFPLTAKLIDGGLGGCTGMAVSFPIDLVKTRLQNQQVAADGTRIYNGILDCGMKIFKNEGFLGMYRGLGLTLVFMFPTRALYLASNDFCRHKLTLPDGTLPMHSQILAGIGAGATQMFIVTPIELLKIQMQEAGRFKTKPISAMKLIIEIVKDKGVMGMYRGITLTALRDISFSAIFFPLFHTCNELGPKRPDGTAVYWVNFLSGLVAGMTAAIIATPPDCIKTRLQTIKKSPSERKFTGAIDMVQKMIKYEGVQSLFKGGICRMMVMAPQFAFTQMVYFFGVGELGMGLFNKK